MNTTPPPELPSASKLLRSTLIAAAVAAVLLVTVVLPAEYGVDPTGIGRALGLTEMGEIKVSLAREAAAADSVEAAVAAGGGIGTTVPAAVSSPGAGASLSPPAQSAAANSHVTEIVLRPNEGKEIKLVMRKDARVTYSWSTGGGVVNYDTHGDAPGIDYHGYGKGTATPSEEGVLVAAFDGAHGWFWRNRGRQAVTVTLRTNGDYQELKRM
ncbi:MAG: transmembrane anchor protein [Gemmatimonadaceae bacterium]